MGRTVLLLALFLPLPAFAVPIGDAFIQIIDGTPGSGDVFYDLITEPGTLSFSGTWANSPGIDGKEGIVAGDASLFAESDFTLRARAEISQNDATVSNRRIGVATARAGASYTESYQIAGPAGATGFVDVQISASLSGTFDVPTAFLSDADVLAAVLGFSVSCSVSLGSCFDPGVSIVQNGNVWTVGGTFGGVVSVPVNEISDFHANLLASATASGASAGASSAAFFDNSLTFSVTSLDPDVVVTRVPEASGAALLGLSLAVFASLRRRSSVG